MLIYRQGEGENSGLPSSNEIPFSKCAQKFYTSPLSEAFGSDPLPRLDQCIGPERYTATFLKQAIEMRVGLPGAYFFSGQGQLTMPR